MKHQRYIKDPVGITFVVEPVTLTKSEKKRISKVISVYKESGRKMVAKSSRPGKNVRKSKKKNSLA